MGRQADGPPGAFALSVAREFRREMGDRRLSGRALADILGKSEKYARERISGAHSFALNDIESFARHIGIEPEQFIARIEANVRGIEEDASVRPPASFDELSARRPRTMSREKIAASEREKTERDLPVPGEDPND